MLSYLVLASGRRAFKMTSRLEHTGPPLGLTSSDFAPACGRPNLKKVRKKCGIGRFVTSKSSDFTSGLDTNCRGSCPWPDAVGPLQRRPAMNATLTGHIARNSEPRYRLGTFLQVWLCRTACKEHYVCFEYIAAPRCDAAPLVAVIGDAQTLLSGVATTSLRLALR